MQLMIIIINIYFIGNFLMICILGFTPEYPGCPYLHGEQGRPGDWTSRSRSRGLGGPADCQETGYIIILSE